ncbi:MAG TPA: hypothetical protein VIS27_01470 [Yeosuana sp.]
MSTQQYCRVGKIISGIEIESELNKDYILLSDLQDLNVSSEKNL